MKTLFLLPMAALTLSLAGCGGAASTGATPSSPAAPSPLTPTRAYNFIDSLGVNTHIFFTGSAFSAYADPTVAESAISYLGFHYLRDGAANLSPSQVASLAAVANKTKARYDFALGSGGTVDLTATLSGIRGLLSAAPGSVATIEGSNEVNNVFEAVPWAVTYNGATVDMCHHSYAPVVAEQHDLYQTVHADSLLQGVPVYNFSVVNLNLTAPVNGCTSDFTADLANIGDVSALADYENLHGYPYQGAAPGTYFPGALTAANPVHSKPITFTETGYTTGQTASANPYLAVTDDIQAKYELDAVFDLYRLGVTRTFLYELLDDAPDTPASDPELHYGMFYATGSPKPVATAFHNLLGILQDNGATAATFTPSSVALTLTQSLTAAIRDANTLHVLLQKSDGTNEFIVWGEPTLWNLATHSEYPPFANNAITLTLPKAYAAINVYDPMTGAAPIQQTTNASTVSFQVLDHPVVVEFR